MTISAGDEAASHACSQLLAAISTNPLVPLALRSLLSPSPMFDSPSPPAGPKHAALVQEPALPNQGAYAPPRAGSAEDLSTERQNQALIVQMTMHAALRPLSVHVPDTAPSPSGSGQMDHSSNPSSLPATHPRTDRGGASPRPPTQQQTAVRVTSNPDCPDAVGCVKYARSASVAAAHVACHVISAPQLLTQLPAAARKQLSQPGVLMTVMAAMQHVASTEGRQAGAMGRDGGLMGNPGGRNGQDSVGSSEGRSKGGGQSGRIRLEGPQDAVIALGNLAGLLAGERVMKASQVGSAPWNLGV